MPFCVVVSAYCGPHRSSSLSIITKVFQCGVDLLTRCGSMDDGFVLLAVQNVEGRWSRKEWTDWNTVNGRKSVLEWMKRLETECVVRLQSISQSAATSTAPESGSAVSAHRSMLETVRLCVADCKAHGAAQQRESRWVSQIAIVVEEHGLILGDDEGADLHSHSVRWQRARSELASWCRADAVCLNLIAICSPSKNRKYSDFKLVANRCSLCFEPFYGSKPLKKEHFNTERHRIALRQIEIQRVAHCRRPDHGPNAVNAESAEIAAPPLKRRRVSHCEPDGDGGGGADVDVDGERDCASSCRSGDGAKWRRWQCRSVLFWQSAVAAVHGLFRWMTMRVGSAEEVVAAMAMQMASRWKPRRIAMGSLMAECQLFGGPKANHFAAPSNESNKVLCTETADQRQWLSEWLLAGDGEAAAIDIDVAVDCPPSILQQNGLSLGSGTETLSVLGFLDRDNNQRPPLPVLSRHFVTPRGDGGGGQHIALFLRDLMVKWRKIAVVDLSGPPQSKWFGVLGADTPSNGRPHCLRLDVLSPYFAAPRLFGIDAAKRPTPQYAVPQTVGSAPTTMLAVYDSVSTYFPTESNVVKDFEKLVRSIKLTKGGPTATTATATANGHDHGTAAAAHCFAVAESIRRRSRIFQIPHLLHHLQSVVLNETDGGGPAGGGGNGEDRRFEALRQMVTRSVTDKGAVIALHIDDGDGGPNGDGAATSNPTADINTKPKAPSPSSRGRGRRGRRGRNRGGGRGRGKRRGHRHHRSK